VAFSVLVHELGHAAVCLAWGSGADIVLHGMGGSTQPRDLSRFGTWRTALLNLAGCAAGTALAAAALGTIYAAGARRIAIGLIEINIWFSLFNLLPVMPMDGGKFVSGLLRAAWGVRGERVGHAFGLALGTGAALFFYMHGVNFGALLCAAMAWGEGRSLRSSLSMTEADMTAAVMRVYAEVALARKDFETALRLGRTNFHNEPGPLTAAAAAIAAAGLGDAREMVSWLRAAVRLGLAPAEIRAKEFDAVRGNEEFKEFEEGLGK
jgi:hypothetical protein